MAQAQEELSQLQQRVGTGSPAPKSPKRKGKGKQGNTPELSGRNPFGQVTPATPTALLGHAFYRSGCFMRHSTRNTYGMSWV